MTSMHRAPIALLAASFLLAACGGDDDSADEAEAATTAATTAAAGDTSAPDASGVDVAPVVEHLTDVHGGADWTASVGDVTADGATVVIGTSLEDAATAVEVCDAAAMVAYGSTVKAEGIVVNDAGGAALARGEAGSDCTEA